MSEPTIWGIHGGRTGASDSLILENEFVTVGWHQLGDLLKSNGIIPFKQVYVPQQISYSEEG